MNSMAFPNTAPPKEAHFAVGSNAWTGTVALLYFFPLAITCSSHSCQGNRLLDVILRAIHSCPRWCLSENPLPTLLNSVWNFAHNNALHGNISVQYSTSSFPAALSTSGPARARIHSKLYLVLFVRLHFSSFGHRDNSPVTPILEWDPFPILVLVGQLYPMVGQRRCVNWRIFSIFHL